MPHLRMDYSPGLEALVDVDALCRAMRAAMVARPEFPMAGVRVRAHRAMVAAVGDGGADRHFLHMELMIGGGRSDAAKAATLEALYAAAEACLRPTLDGLPFALSLELRELSAHRINRWNGVRDALGG